MNKKRKGRETAGVIAAAIAALAVFLFLLLGLNWNLVLCMVLAVGIYFAVTLILMPVDRIGKVEVTAFANGEMLHERLGEAAADYERMKKAAAKIRESGLAEDCVPLLKTAGNILAYLTENPEKIPSARRYIDYYQETAANVLEHYVQLQETGLYTREAQEAERNTKETVRTLNDAFQMQLEKLMQNELMDMEADLNLLKQTLKSEGWQGGMAQKAAGREQKNWQENTGKPRESGQ